MSKLKIYNKSYITIKNQDILDVSIERTKTSNIIVPHVCNNINVFGGGFAGYLASRYPHIKENFHLLGNKSKLGYVQFVDIFHNKTTNNKVIIANMIAQNGIISHDNRRPLNYHALCSCMHSVKNKIKSIIDSDPSISVEINCPKFGSGLAGGDWKFINELIKDIWINTNIYIFLL